jgi:hypothetical protein
MSLVFPDAGSTEVPSYMIVFPRYEDRFSAQNDIKWITNNDILLHGWYFNQETDKLIPPYLGTFMKISPYDKKTGFYRRKNNIYISDIASYENNKAPNVIPLPSEMINTNQNDELNYYGHQDQNFAAWVSSDEILVVTMISSGKYLYAIYSVRTNKWEMVNGDILHFDGYLEVLESDIGGYILVGCFLPEIYTVYKSYQFSRINGSAVFSPIDENIFTPDGISYNLKAWENSAGNESSSDAPVISYKVNLLENSKVYYTAIIDNIYTVIDASNQKNNKPN